MFDNSFINQHRFDYSESSDNEDDETLDLNIIINIHDDAGDKIIPHVPEFENASGFSYTSSHNWALSHRCMPEGFDLEIGQTFNSKNELVNAVKWWYIAHSVEYQVQ